MAETATITLRLEAVVSDKLNELAQKEGLEAASYIQRLLRVHVAESGLLEPEDRDRILLTESLLKRAVAMAVKLKLDGKFDAHFTLTVIDALFADPTFLADYERAIGGPALTRGLPVKASLNMNLGWQIKTAALADPLLDENGRVRRVQVRGRPIQSYTLLKLKDQTDSKSHLQKE